MTIGRLIIGLTLAAMLSAGAAAQDVTHDYNASRDFTTLKTYSFTAPATGEATTEQTTVYDSPFVTERTHAAIAAQLEGRGLTRDDADPDVYVRTRRTFKKDYIVYPYGYPGWGSGYYGPSFYYGWGWGGWYREEKIKGTLTIDVIDAATGALLWRGLGERTMHPTSSPERRAKRIHKEVTKIFKNFPVGTLRDYDDDE